ncbi:hypothetical protein V0R37_22635, partial [Pollutimonas sp. H1-120]|uniref:hypothetical protein n=1 Tax=Pollutimonas sp. H1-120 TaxID=3148824 RepID=UPI003B51AC8E
AVENWNWAGSQKFRIVDERHEPKPEADFKADRMYLLCPDGEYRDAVSMIEESLNQSNTSQTNWHERGELPPVGAECEYYSTEMR